MLDASVKKSSAVCVGEECANLPASYGLMLQPRADVRTVLFMTRILLTNDDGIHSDGLIKLEEALREVGEVYTVAPASEMSGASHSLTLARPLRIRQIDERHWTVDGTPTDCVTLALNKIQIGRASCRERV